MTNFFFYDFTNNEEFHITCDSLDEAWRLIKSSDINAATVIQIIEDFE